MRPKNHNVAWTWGGIGLAVSFGMSAYATPLSGPGAHTPPAQAAAPDNNTTQTTNNTVAEARSPETEIPPVKSLFYTQEEMAEIHHYLAIYITYSLNHPGGNEVEKYLKGLEGKGSAGAQKYYTYPQFFLESLVYHSPNDWVVTVNNHRINQKTAQRTPGNIRILDIDKDKVSFEWAPGGTDAARIKEAPDKIYDSSVKIDRANGVIIFTLHTNQTFSAYAMQVLEGKVQPVTVQNNIENAARAQPAPPPKTAEHTPGEASPSPPDDSDRNGLSGLINSYKNLKGITP